jgi:hypothetical protein
MGRAPEAVVPSVAMTARMVHFFREKERLGRKPLSTYIGLRTLTPIFPAQRRISRTRDVEQLAEHFGLKRTMTVVAVSRNDHSSSADLLEYIAEVEL